MRKINSQLIMLVIAIFFMGQSIAQEQTAVVDQKEKKQVVDSLAYKMETLYVFPDKGKEMADYIRKQYQDKAYDEMEDAREFARPYR